MGDIRELLGRLNPQTVKFDTGRGGIAELTNQDIAAALAFVPAGLGREVLIACWWPDGGRLGRGVLMRHVVALVSQEWAVQGRQLAEARTDLGIAEAIAGWNGVVTGEQRRELERARARWECVRDRVWPKEMPAMLPTLTTAVLGEIAGRSHCERCEGRGETMAGELRVMCPACQGRGIVPVSDRQRAERIGRHVESYRRHWSGAYLWLLDAMLAAEQQAARHLAGALRRDAA